MRVIILENGIEWLNLESKQIFLRASLTPSLSPPLSYKKISCIAFDDYLYVCPAPLVLGTSYISLKKMLRKILIRFLFLSDQ